ncbi:unnamed protein product [Meloidogyne enterolobii]|uniref:Uncharacterized protein n=1 Tax=Meloidogyne enterolobii TaxID=390850 RepID=A0ACB1ABX5_MELEN
MLKIDQKEEKMHEIDGTKYITKEEVFITMELLWRRMDNVEKNLNSKNLDDLFVRVKYVVSNILYVKDLTFCVQLLFNIVKLLKKKEAVYKNYVNEGKTEEIIKEVDAKIENVKHFSNSLPIFEMRKFLAKEHMEYVTEILNDKEIRKVLQKNDGSIYCLHMILGGHPSINKIMQENGLLEVDGTFKLIK